MGSGPSVCDRLMWDF